MEGYCSTGQSPQRAVVPVEEEEEEIKPFSRPNKIKFYRNPNRRFKNEIR
jgi:hypothetical protein